MLDVNGQSIGDGTLELVKFAETASAVNEITVTNSATGNAPQISATGDDTNIDLRLATKGTGGVVFNAGAVGTPSITTTSDTNTGIFFPAADTIAFTEGGTEAMRIKSDGNVSIKNSSGFGNLSVTNRMQFYNTASDGVGGVNSVIGSIDAQVRNYGDNISTARFSAIEFCVDPSTYYYGDIRFFTNSADGTTTVGTERMRIDAGGNVLIAKTSSNVNVVGCELGVSGYGAFAASGAPVLYLDRLASDGDIVRFFQAGVQEGTISVSGATVSYNGFTGSHWSRFIDESKPDVLRGTVMESLDQMTDWYVVEFTDSENNTQKKPYALKANEQEGDVIDYAWNTEKKDEDDNDIIEQVQATIVKEKDVKHVMSKISDTVEAKNVYGVFSAWDNDDLINNDFYVASVGSYVVRIKAGQTVSKGDLLQSNGDGTAKVQADDLVRASSFAKVLSNTVIDTYEDGSFIVPCSLMC
jgi:hypothetical protein